MKSAGVLDTPMEGGAMAVFGVDARKRFPPFPFLSFFPENMHPETMNTKTFLPIKHLAALALVSFASALFAQTPTVSKDWFEEKLATEYTALPSGDAWSIDSESTFQSNLGVQVASLLEYTPENPSQEGLPVTIEADLRFVMGALGEPPAGYQLALSASNDGSDAAYYAHPVGTDGWLKLTGATPAEGTTAHVVITLNYETETVTIQIDGTTMSATIGGQTMTALPFQPAQQKVSTFALHGQGVLGDFSGIDSRAAAASIDGVNYETFAEAVAAGTATASPPIVLYADASATLAAGATLYVNANGHAFTATTEEGYSVVNDGYAYVSTAEGAYVAQIVRNSAVVAKYETLAAALDAAVSGDTVQLLADITGVDETFELRSKNITIDGDGHSITAAENTSPRSVVESYGGARNMFVVQSGNVAFENITLDGGSTHFYTFLVQAKNADNTVTFEDVALLHGAEADSSGADGVGYGAAVQVDGGTVLVMGDFYADTHGAPLGEGEQGDRAAGIFPFTAILYQTGGIYFYDNANVSIGQDLLLVGMVGAVDVSTPENKAMVQEMLDAMNVPAGFYPYTLKISDDAFTSFTGASPLGWNGIIDYGREIMNVADSLGMEMDPDTTPVETGLLSDTVLPDTFTFEDDNFTVNGNGYALSGTIEYTDDAGILENIVLGTEDAPLVLDMTGLGEGNAIHLGSDITATSVIIKVTDEQATTMGHAIVTWDAAHETAEEAASLETGIFVEIVDAQGEPILDPETNEPKEASVVWDLELGLAYIGPCEARLTGPTHEKPIYTSLADAIARAANSGDTVTLLIDIANFTGTQNIAKSLVLDGAGHTIAAAPVSEHRDVVNAWIGGTSMFKLQTGNITFQNITLDGDATHAYTYLISADNSSISLTTENITLLHGGELCGDADGALIEQGAGYGAAIHLNNGAGLTVKDGFYADTHGASAAAGQTIDKSDGVFPFTAILPENLESGTWVTFELTEDTDANPTVDIGEDLLLVGMVGDLIGQYGIDAVQGILNYMQVPSRFIPYTLTLSDGSAYAFTGASPRTWNDIIDYGKEIMDVSTAIGYEGLDKVTTPVEVGLLTDTVLPAGAAGEDYDFLYEDANFSVNGNGNALSGTIKFTDDADGGMLRDIVLGTDANPLTLDLSGTDNPVDLGDGVIIEDVIVLMTEEQATIGKIVFDWDTTDENPPDDEQGVEVTVVDDYSGTPTGVKKELVWDEEHGIAYIGPCEARLTDADGGNPVYTTLAIAFASATNGCTVSLMTNVTYAAQTAETLVFDHAGASVTFDLNGFAFGSDLATQLEVKAGTLALVDSEYPAGDGGMFATNTAFQVDSGATLTISSGVYVGDFSNNGTVAISGGRFSDPVPEAHCATGYVPATLDEAVNPYTVVPGGFLITVASVSDTGLGLDLLDMTSYAGYDIHYELRRGSSTIQRGADPAAFEIPLYPDDRNDSRNPSGIYRIVALMVSQSNRTVTNEVPSANAVGVLKVASSLTNSIAAVPWVSLASNPQVATNVSVSALLHPANLSTGDRLLSYDTASGRYHGWSRTAEGNWDPILTAAIDGVTVAPAPENWRPEPGSAFWVMRAVPKDADGAKPYFLYGQYRPGDYNCVIAGGTKAAPENSLCANPTASSVALSQLSFEGEIGADDTIVLNGDGDVSTIYVRNKANTAWGRWRKVRSGGIVTSVWTEDGSIAPGSGFWYVRRSSDNITLVWPGWEE